MIEQDYSCEFQVSVEPISVYQAVSENVDSWWTISAYQWRKTDDLLRVQFGPETYKLMKTIESIPGHSIIWQVLEAHIGHENLKDKNEWVGTRILWRLEPVSSGTTVYFRHQGLTTKLQCYEQCKNGWSYFLGSLKSYLETGKGRPFGT